MDIFRYTGETIEENLSDWTNFHNKFVNPKIKKDDDFILVYLDFINKDLFENLYKSSEIKRLFDVDTFYDPRPIIFIGIEELNSIEDLEIQNRLFHKLKIPRSYRYLDSSIWNFYHYILEDEFESRLEENIRIIRNDYSNLYSTDIAKEFIEFQTRLSSQSHIINLKGHGSFVVPYVFHSETKMEALYKKVKSYDNFSKTLLEYIIKINVKWRFLLIDDYSEIPLARSVANPVKNLTKSGLIGKILKNIGIGVLIIESDGAKIEDYFYNGDFKIEIYCIKKMDGIDNIATQIESNSYDILLIDYLLGYNSNKDQRDYGYQLFSRLKENVSENEKTLLNNFWIFNISSFDAAMANRLREQGYSNQSEKWYYDRGGDPVNTPELFIYNLLNFMRLQISKCLYNIDDLIEFFANMNPYKASNEDNNLPILEEDMNQKISILARDNFGSFIYKFYTKEILNKDAERGSLFAKSVIKLIKTQPDLTNAHKLADHFRHLLYLLSFDPGSRLHEAWEEVQLIRRKLKDVKNHKLDEFLWNIEDYLAKNLSQIK